MPVFTPVDFDPFAEAKEIEKITYTNEPQREIWLSCILGGHDANLSYNESVSLAIKGQLNLTAFNKAIRDLVQRHEALSATISPNGETLIIYKEAVVELPLVDLTDIPGEDENTELQSFLRSVIDTPLDLYAGPLFRVFMHRLAEDAWLFTVIKHHIIGDGWSTGIILEDLSRMYNAYSKGESVILEAALQISDYANDQARFRLTKEYKQTQAYWLDVYKNNVPVLNLPTDRPRQSPRSFKGHRIDQPLPAALAAQIKTVGGKAGASLVTTLLAAFEVLLYQTTQQTDLVVGLPASGQAASGLTSVVGHCVNLLPLRSRITPALSFTDYLKKRKKEVLDAYDHQRLTFGELISKLYIPRDASRIPLVPVIFNIDMGMDNAVAFDGLDYKLISNPRNYENFELYLNATRSKDGIVLEWSYNTDLFDAATIQGFNSDYYTLLEGIVTNPQMSITDLTGIQPHNNETNNAAAIPIPAGKNIISLFQAAANTYKDKTALSFHDTSLSYEQLNQKVNQLCHFLTQKRIGKGAIVALVVDRSIEMVVCLLAILKAGAAYLPLDPTYPTERITYMLGDAEAKMLMVSAPYAAKFPSSATEVVINDLWPTLPNYSGEDQDINITGNHLAYVIYTSGSTGKPKGVQLTHLNLVNFLLSMQKTPGLTAADRLLAVTTISFDIAGLELYLPLITGAELVVADAETARDGRILVNIIKQKNISFLQATPSTWQMLIDAGLAECPDLKALSGGEPLSRELTGKLLEKVASLWNMYGPTETTIWSTLKQVLFGKELITIGLPIDNTQLYIMDEAGSPLPDGQTGEIYIGGLGVAKGYLNRPELTKEKFVADTLPHTAGATLYRTGDLGKILPNGEVLCLGRIDNQVKIRGHRIELGEIENILSPLPGIKQAAVIAQDDALLQKYLVAYIVSDTGNHTLDKLQIAGWKKQLAGQLPDYMVPEEFMSLQSFPLTPNGKTDRKAFPKPERRQQSRDNVTTLPVTDSEKLVARIFADTLGLSSVQLTDDFFELGGHSLLAVKVMIAIEKETGERLPLATFFDNSTVAKLAAQLEGSNTAHQWDTIVPIKPSGTKPPLFIVHGSGLNLLMFKAISEHFDSNQPLYGVQAIGLSKPTELPDTVEAIAAYHIPEILTVNPTGPYAIAGYSYGGFIAYEIAKQLIAVGRQVSFLGMIDTNAWAAMQPKETSTRIVKKTVRQFKKIPFLVESFIKYPKDAFDYQLYILKKKMRSEVPADPFISNYTLYENQIRENYDKVIAQYQLAPFDIQVSLFRVEKRLYFIDDRTYLGWDKLALRGVKIYTVPGDHRTFLEVPNDRQFATIIQGAMDEVIV